MKHSIRFRITFLLTALIVSIVFITWFINKTFLSDYYLHDKMKTLGQTYLKVQKIYEKNGYEDNLTEDDTLAIEQLSSDKNVNIYVVSTYTLSFSYPSLGNYSAKEYDQIIKKFQEYTFPYNDANTKKGYPKLLRENNNYEVYKIYDEIHEAYYIDLFGHLVGNKVIFLRTSFESIKESVSISNKFLAYIGIIATIFGTLAMFIISKKFTKPIQDLSNIAKKMSDLDFNIKYKVNSQDEIGELGQSINFLSEKLETTISELKSANNELLTDIQKKDEIDEMRKEFLSNVSHELKTPISLIQGYAEGLKENINEDPESRDFYCDVIMDEASKMNKMVKKLLTLNQLESGNNQVNIERFDIISLIRSILNATEILIKQKEIIIRFDEEEPLYVWADEYLIEEVITNYLSNAINHVDDKKVIEIKLIRHDDVVRVAVFNTGENIPVFDLDKIWDKFYKVDKARSREYGGNGIGLSIVKAIMKSLNKECGVINHSIGVEFWFELDMKS